MRGLMNSSYRVRDKWGYRLLHDVLVVVVADEFVLALDVSES
jgi:hypothetical protein